MLPEQTCLTDEAIAALAAGETASRSMLAHLEACDACRELVSAVCARRTDAEPGLRDPGRLVAGSMLGHYRIIRPLGSGGMGVVYLARDLALDRDVAVKLLHGGDDRAHARLARESQALAKLNHPHVVTAHEVGRRDDASYLVMEYVDGGTLRDWLAATPRTPIEIARVFAEAARGLAAAHERGLVHRDVKPDNVLVGSDGRARVSDFGLVGADPTSGLRATNETQDGALLGTLRYMAPEILHGGDADTRSDQWSLCASLWESLFGQPPFPGTTPLVIADAMEAGLPALPATPELPTWLRRVLERGLAIDPARRFNTLDGLAEALSPSRSSVRRTAVALVAGAAVTAGIAFAATTRDSAPTCSSGLDDVWGASHRNAFATHLGTFGGVGSSIAKLVGPKLDDYAAKWSHQREDVCSVEAADPAGRVPAMRVACLDTRRQALAALVTAMNGVDAKSMYSIPTAVNELPVLDECAAVERLVGRQPLPDSPGTRARIVALQHDYAAAHAEGTLGHTRQTIDRIVAIADAADELGYRPLVAEALDFVGRAEVSLVDDRALPTLRRALLASIASADDRQSAGIAIDLYSSALRGSVPVAERDQIRAEAEAIAHRLRWHHDPGSPLMDSYLSATKGVDDRERGRLDLAETELRHAIALGSAAVGSRDPRLAPARRALGMLLVVRGFADEAAVVSAQALDFDGAWVQIGDGIDGLGDGSIAVSMLDIATRLFGVGRDDQALDLVHQMRRATASPQTSPFFLLALDDLEAEIALAKGDVVTARRLNERTLAAMGPNALPQHVAGFRETRAELLEASGDLVGAEAEYRAVVPLVAGSHEADQFVHLSLARCLVKLGKLDEARTILERTLSQPILAPRDAPLSWLRLAELRWKHGDHAAAIDAASTGRSLVARLPAMTVERDALDRWLATHHREIVSAP